MRISGTAYNGNDGEAAEGAVVTLRVGTDSYSTFVGSDGIWTLQIPGNPGTSSTLTMTFSGRTRTLSTRQISAGQTPSWTPSWMSALAHRTTTGVSRNGIVPNEKGGFQITVTGANSLQISSGVVAHTDYSDSENWWVASWENATAFAFKEWNGSAYVDVVGAEPAGGWLLGVERISSTGRCAYSIGRVSGSDVETLNATYTGLIGGYADNFIPLALVTRTGGVITSVTSYRNYLNGGRVTPGPILSVAGAQSGSTVIYDGAGSTNIDSSSLTMTDRTSGRYTIIGKADVLTKETGAVPYWDYTSFGSQGSGDTHFEAPIQIALDYSGNVYVADLVNARLKKHASDGTYVSQVTGLTGIQGVCVDPSNNVYVAYGSTVRKYNSSLSLQWTSTLGGESLYQMCTDGTHVFVTTDEDKINRYLCTTGAGLSALASSGSGNGQLNNPNGIATDGTYLYVADNGNQRIHKLTLAGAYVAKWFTTVGGVSYPSPAGVSVNPVNGNLLVTDFFVDAIQEFTNTGTLVQRFGSSGFGLGFFMNPSATAISSATKFYVSDSSNDRIQIFEYLTPTDGLEWYDLQVEMFYKKNAGAWTSMGSKNVSNFSVMPDYWSFVEDVSAVSLAAADTISFRVTVSNTSTGSIVWDAMNYQFRLIPEELS